MNRLQTWLKEVSGNADFNEGILIGIIYTLYTEGRSEEDIALYMSMNVEDICGYIQQCRM